MGVGLDPPPPMLLPKWLVEMHRGTLKAKVEEHRQQHNKQKQSYFEGLVDFPRTNLELHLKQGRTQKALAESESYAEHGKIHGRQLGLYRKADLAGWKRPTHRDPTILFWGSARALIDQ